MSGQPQCHISITVKDLDSLVLDIVVRPKIENRLQHMKIRRTSGNSYIALSVCMRWFSGYCLRVSNSHLEFTFLPVQTLWLWPVLGSCGDSNSLPMSPSKSSYTFGLLSEFPAPGRVNDNVRKAKVE